VILITGASGNVGSEVLKQTAAKPGLRIRAAYTSLDKSKSAPAGVEPVLMDYAKPETVRAALQGIEKVFLVGPPTPDVAELEGKFVDEVKKSDVKHLVTLSAMGGRKAIFPSLHRDSEEKIERSGFPFTFLRPNGFMQNFIVYDGVTIKTQNAFYGAQGGGAVSHIDIRDIARVGVHVLSTGGHEGHAYTLTGPEAITNAQAAERLSHVLGRTIRYIDLAPDAFKQALMSAGVPEWSANAVTDLQALYRNGGASEVTGEVERITGRTPVSFDEFAADYRDAFQPSVKAAR
jgi:uncharacterized protein YbjT (DUF2867 family)